MKQRLLRYLIKCHICFVSKLGAIVLRFWGFKDIKGSFDLTKAKSILVIRMDEIGDVVMFTPFLKKLRGICPASKITLIVRPPLRSLLQTCPYVDTILCADHDAPNWRLPFIIPLRSFLWARKNLWPEAFEIAIQPRRGADDCYAGLLTFFSGAPRRYAFSERVEDRKKWRNSGFDRLYTRLFESVQLKHEVQYSLELLSESEEAVNSARLELWPDESDILAAKSFFAKSGFGGKKIIAIAVGARAAKRVWPAQRFLEVAHNFINEGFSVIFIGGPAEHEISESLARELGKNSLSTSGKFSLRQTFAILKSCILFLGNDSGPMHMAAAAGVPVIEISCHPKSGDPAHWNSPFRYGPWGVEHTILQPQVGALPCASACIAKKAHCILEVSVQNVISAANKHLSLHR